MCPHSCYAAGLEQVGACSAAAQLGTGTPSVRGAVARSPAQGTTEDLLVAQLQQSLRARLGLLVMAFTFALPLLLVAPSEAHAAPSYKHPLFCERTYYGTNYETHKWGLDIFSTTYNYIRGHEVMASAGGKVVYIDPGNGQVNINHSNAGYGSGYETVYAHMSSLQVTIGETVETGELLGFVSDIGYATAAHLHYGQNYDGVGKQVAFNGVLYPYAYNTDSKGPNFKSSNCLNPPATDIFDLSSGRQADIKWLYDQGITAGCGSYFGAPTRARYCPQDLVNRGAMASFLDRYLNLPSTSNDYFDDDDGNIHEAAINRIAAAGITSGCGSRLYCPDSTVLRDQMATFLDRSLNLPSTTQDFFTDDNDNKHEAAINRVAAAGITSGCGGTNYCPSGSVNRGSLAVFLENGKNYR